MFTHSDENISLKELTAILAKVTKRPPCDTIPPQGHTGYYVSL